MHFNDTNQTIFCNHQLFNTNYWNNVSEISYIPETKWRPQQPVMIARSPFFSSQNRYPKISSVYFGGKAVKLHSRAFSISLSTSRGTPDSYPFAEKKNRLLGNNGVVEVETIGRYGRGILSCHSIWRSCHSHVAGDVIWIRPIVWESFHQIR